MATPVDQKLGSASTGNHASRDYSRLISDLIRLARTHLHVIVPILLTLTVFSWLITRGDWRFFDREGLGAYYDALGDSLLKGQLDVPRTAILPEAFIRDGKSYGYFGITPALPRIPLNFLFASLWGQWTRVSMTLACLVSLVFTYKLFLLIRNSQNAKHGPLERIWIALSLLSAGLGSSLIFLASRAFVYHEATMWGAALSLMSIYYLLMYLGNRRLSLLALAGTTALLAFFARPTGGAGAMLAVVVSTLVLSLARTSMTFGMTSHRTPPIHAALAVSFAVVTVCAYFTMNYIKFHTWDGVPLRYYFQYQQMPERMLLTGGKQFHLANFRTGFVAYLGRIGVDFGPHFPWLFMRQQATVYPEARIDINDWSSGLPGSVPALLMMSCLGLWSLIRGKTVQTRQLRLPIIALGLGGSVIFFTVGICERYLHDLYPFLILTGVVGLNWVISQRRRPLAAFALVVFSVLTFISIAVNTAFALDYQRELVWGVQEEKQAEFTRWRATIDHWVRFDRPAQRGR